MSTISLHGTAASINQHPARNNEGHEGHSREHASLNESVSELKWLPDWYIEVSPYHLPNDTPVPVCSKPSTTDLLESFVVGRWNLAAGCIFNILGCVSCRFSIKSIVSRYFSYAANISQWLQVRRHHQASVGRSHKIYSLIKPKSNCSYWIRSAAIHFG